MTKPGNTKIMADNVPAAEAIVCTMLFSWTEWSWNFRNIAMEITAAGIEVANVNPTFNPKYTFAAVKILCSVRFCTIVTVLCDQLLNIPAPICDLLFLCGEM